MRGRYQLVLNVPDPIHGTWRAARIGRFRTVERALRASERILSRHVSEETRATRERFAFSCSLYDMRRSPGCKVRGTLVRGWQDLDLDRLDAPARIVPSVGELGWTP